MDTSKRKRTIAVVAPSGIPDPEGLQRGVELVRSWGHEVVLGRYVGETCKYTAGTVEQRSSDLRWAFQDPAIDVVWTARGGFGIQHCLSSVDLASAAGKMVIGYSDATALLQMLYLHGHRNLFHGPRLDGLASDAEQATQDSIRQMLSMPDAPGYLQLQDDTAEQLPYPVAGPLVGGNLTMLASLAGGPFSLRARDAILMLEDVTEHAFRLDRCLVQLTTSGALEGVKAIVLGEFVRCYMPKDATYTASQLVAELLRPAGVPVLQKAPFGHGSLNLTWPYGRHAELRGNCLHF